VTAPASTVTVTTPLPASAVTFRSLTATEGTSTPFSYVVELHISNTQTGVFDALLNQPITVTLATASGGRSFSGVCVQLIEAVRKSRDTKYIAYLAPSVWPLGRSVNSRIFQNISVPDILKSTLPSTNTLSQLTGTYPPRQFCVQYRESDLAFVSRLMEEEGIYYFFAHSPNGHTLILVDDASTASPTPGPSPVPFGPPAFGNVSAWSKSQLLTAGLATEDDFNFQFPSVSLTSSAPIARTVQAGTVTHHLDIGNSSIERYEFPGEYATWSDSSSQDAVKQSQRLAQLRIEEEAAGALQIQGVSGCPGFTPGYDLALNGHPDGDGKYLITSVSHSAVQNPNSRLQYTNTFVCVPSTVPFRPIRITPKPIVAGMQSGFVVGPPGVTTYSDRYGRVKVQFHWDRLGKSDDKSSCWVRVGAMLPGDGAIPPIGREVLVAFEEGDPDRPIIIGSAHSPSFP
jgi:type VI secretion system secreted protein VgrG